MGISGPNLVREDSEASAFPPLYIVWCLSHEMGMSFKASHLASPAKNVYQIRKEVSSEFKCFYSSEAG